MRVKETLLCCALTLILTRSCEGALVTYTYTGGVVAIPDNNSAGVNLDITVPDNFDLVSFSDASLTFSPAHTWVGDLVITLTHVPTGTAIDLIRRVGSTSTGGLGDSSNMNGTYTFSNSTTTRVIDNAATRGDNQRVINGTYAPTTNSFNGIGGPTYTGESIQDLTSTFSPISNMSGVWRLNVADLAGGDTGSVSGFSFTVDATPVPEPGSMLLLAGGLCVGSVMFPARRKPKSATSKLANQPSMSTQTT